MCSKSPPPSRPELLIGARDYIVFATDPERLGRGAGGGGGERGKKWRGREEMCPPVSAWTLAVSKVFWEVG